MHLTELEEKLAQPGGLALQQQLTAQLDAAVLRVGQKLAASVPRAEYLVHKKALDALQAALEVLQVWPANTDALPTTLSKNVYDLPTPTISFTTTSRSIS